MNADLMNDALAQIGRQLLADAPPWEWASLGAQCWVEGGGIRLKVTAGTADGDLVELGDRAAATAYLPAMEQLYQACWQFEQGHSWRYACVVLEPDGTVRGQYTYPD